jgi:hypothetical protein
MIKQTAQNEYKLHQSAQHVNTPVIKYCKKSVYIKLLQAMGNVQDSLPVTNQSLSQTLTE